MPPRPAPSGLPVPGRAAVAQHLAVRPGVLLRAGPRSRLWRHRGHPGAWAPASESPAISLGQRRLAGQLPTGLRRGQPGRPGYPRTRRGRTFRPCGASRWPPASGPAMGSSVVTVTGQTEPLPDRTGQADFIRQRSADAVRPGARARSMRDCASSRSSSDLRRGATRPQEAVMSRPIGRPLASSRAPENRWTGPRFSPNNGRRKIPLLLVSCLPCPTSCLRPSARRYRCRPDGLRQGCPPVPGPSEAGDGPPDSQKAVELRRLLGTRKARAARRCSGAAGRMAGRLTGCPSGWVGSRGGSDLDRLRARPDWPQRCSLNAGLPGEAARNAGRSPHRPYAGHHRAGGRGSTKPTLAGELDLVELQTEPACWREISRWPDGRYAWCSSRTCSRASVPERSKTATSSRWISRPRRRPRHRQGQAVPRLLPLRRGAEPARRLPGVDLGGSGPRAGPRRSPSALERLPEAAGRLLSIWPYDEVIGRLAAEAAS